MKRNMIYVIYVFLFSSLSLSNGENEPSVNPLVGLNFSGKAYLFSRHDVSNAGSPFLKRLIDNPLNSAKDPKGNYFIARPQYEGLFLVEILTKRSLEMNTGNRDRILSFADFFGFEKLSEQAKAVKSSQKRTVYTINGKSSTKKQLAAVCPACPHMNRSILASQREAKEHLLKEHRATIVKVTGGQRGLWSISYRLPNE